jgi:outer membrane protein OmpA-like peptidoglycan-associated protein
MRHRIVKCVLVLAACLPALALAQRVPAAAPMAEAHREGSWEVGVAAGGTYLDHQLGLLIQQGLRVSGASDTAVGRIAFGGVATVSYHLSRSWSLTAGSGVEVISSATILQPFGAIAWTPSIDAGTIPFVSLGGGVTNITWKGYRATSKFGVHLGVGLRQMLSERLALRVEAREQYESFSKAAAANAVFNGIGSLGLSWFIGGRRVPVAIVAVTPADATLEALGATRQLSASPLDSHRRALAGRPVMWTSSDTSVAGVSATGLVTAAGPGSATITATSETATGTARVTVAQAVASLVVTPGTAALTALGQTQQFAVSAQDANGNAIASPSLRWISSDPATASVTASGLVTALKNGTTTIAASSNGHTATASVTVTQTLASIAVTPASATLSSSGATVQLQAQAVDAGGRPVAGQVITWTSGAPAVATVSPAGVVTALSSGTAQIGAAAGGKAGSATVTVSLAARRVPPPPVAVAAPLPTAVNATVVLHNVTFRPNSYRLPAEAQPVLDTIAAAMQSMRTARWEIGGFTSSMGADAKNLRLSRLRALAVRLYLVRHGVPGSRLRAVGYGSANPIATNTTVAGRRQNMRVEIKRLR